MADAKDRFRVGLVQMRAGKDIQENLLEADAFIREAAKRGAHYIQTPENTLLMETEAARLLEKIAPEEATEGLAHFSELAKTLKVWLHIGAIAIKVGEANAVNRAYLFAPNGDIVLRYDKIHMFDVNLPSGETYREIGHVHSRKNGLRHASALGAAWRRHLLRYSLSRAVQGAR